MIRTFKPIHVVLALLVLASLTIACEIESSDQSPRRLGELIHVDNTVSPDIAVLAHRYVFAYMSDKVWGFFGATCEKWIEMDYQWETSMSEFEEDGRVKVTYQRKPERLLGLENIVFYVDVDTGEVEGDNESPTGRSGIAEGCDKW